MNISIKINFKLFKYNMVLNKIFISVADLGGMGVVGV